MATLSMSDPSAVMAAYHNVISGDFNWLLLYYTNESCDELGLDSYGPQGLEELKTRISDLDEIFIAFYREEVDVDPGFIILNYIPSHVSPVKRARALVHSRRIGSIFKKHQAILTLDNLSLLTSENVHQAIINPDSSTFTRHSGKSTPDLLPQKRASPELKAPQLPLQPVRKPPIPTQIPAPDMPRPSFTAIYAPEVTPPQTHTPSPKPVSNKLSNFLRRKKKGEGDVDDLGDQPPPPPPPKDVRSKPITVAYSSPIPMPAEHILRPKRSRSFSDFGVISQDRAPSPYSKHQISATESHIHTLPLKGKWAPVRGDPEERARRRRELEAQKEREEQQAVMEEIERQNRLKKEREEFHRRQYEEEQLRKKTIEEEVRRVTAEKRRREQQEKEQEERKKRELEEKKRMEREKRAREHREAEEWRRQQAIKQQEAEKQAQEAKQQAEAERTRKLKEVEREMKASGKNAEHVGWVTVSNGGVIWKRRFYKFSDDTIYLYRSPKEMEVVLEEVPLKKQVSALKEWHEGYEDLEAIPFSFVVEFSNGKSPWSIYADSQEEKFRIMGLFNISAGL
ncbi:hypothetical protein BJ165DRAFT_1437958 [Panaeolus papilionaceus]|nr:hypothetical protein BJ165DRAFT_1437958 [Panaeolus papilionaceus]